MQRRILIYGATSYTGRLIAKRARHLRQAPIVAGRNAHRVGALADTLGMPARVCALDNPAALDQALADVGVVINAASPFAETAPALVEACLRTRTHYLDVSGELPTFETAYRYDSAAHKRGMMIMPGVGFMIVASDCLAMHVAALVPNAKYVRIGYLRPTSISRGTLRASLAMASSHVTIRRNRQLTLVPASRLQRSFDYGDGERDSVAVSGADVFTAYYSTGINNIETYIEADFISRTLYQVTAGVAETLQFAPVRRWVDFVAQAWPEGPSETQRQHEKCVVVAEAEDSWRRRGCARLVTPNGYDFTAEAATTIARRVMRGDFRPGFQTPGKVYGPNFVIGLAGSQRTELERPFPYVPTDAL